MNELVGLGREEIGRLGRGLEGKGSRYEECEMRRGMIDKERNRTEEKKEYNI